MNVQPRTTTNPPASTSNALGMGTDNTFLTLLMTQLKSQDPMSPMDTNSFVTQLVQFNTLDQITSIRQLIQELAGMSDTGA
jgi:flagellar basal-body rod modification protein FlgD